MLREIKYYTAYTAYMAQRHPRVVATLVGAAATAIFLPSLLDQVGDRTKSQAFDGRQPTGDVTRTPQAQSERGIIYDHCVTINNPNVSGPPFHNPEIPDIRSASEAIIALSRPYPVEYLDRHEHSLQQSANPRGNVTVPRELIGSAEELPRKVLNGDQFCAKR